MPRVHFLDTLWVENFDEIALSRTVKEIESILCFAIFGKNSKIQNGRHFWGGENFLKLPRVHCSDTLWVENFDEIALSHTVKEIEANSCFAIFGENSKWPPFLGRGKFFENCQEYIAQWVENFDEIALSRTVKEIEANLCFAIFGKNSKIQNGRHFWGGENFLKIAKITFLRYPVGRKFRRNRSISHGLGDMSTSAFFSTQNSQLLIYLTNYSLIYEAITPKRNPIQAINPMNLHTKFQKDRLNSIP